MKDIVKLKIKGVGGFVINLLKNANIYILGTKTTDSGILICIKGKDLRRTERLLIESCREYEIISRSGFLWWLKSLSRRIGLYVGLALVIIAACMYSRGLFKVEIQTDALEATEIIDILTEEGITLPSYNIDVDVDKIKAKLEALPSVSYATVMRRGTTLIVQAVAEVKPESLIDMTEPSAVVAAGDAIVTRVVAVAGTPQVVPGDIVKKGEVLIAPHYAVGESFVAVKAVGEVYGRVFRQEIRTYPDTVVTKVRTGKMTTATQISLFGLKSKMSVPYELYEVIVEEKYLSDLIPIKVKYYTFYELIEKAIPFDFEDNENEIIERAFADFSTRVPESSTILKHYHSIKRLDNLTVLELYYETEEKIYESKNN